MTWYGWSAAPARGAVDERNPIVGRLAATQRPLMVNSVAADKRVAEVLFEQGSERVLALPILARACSSASSTSVTKRGRSRSRPPTSPRPTSCRKEIRNESWATKNLYGIGGVTVVETAEAAPGRLREVQRGRREAALLPEPSCAPTPPRRRALSKVIRVARERMGAPQTRSRRGGASSRARSSAAARRPPAVLAIPASLPACRRTSPSASGRSSSSTSPLADDALRLINERLAASLKRREVATAASRANWSAAPQ